ncbi:hypothetical protein LINPERHAP1_LOCUS38003, partial [Linum perenne]
VHWDPDPEDWLTLNTDDSALTDSSKAAAAGGVLVRDVADRFLVSFTSNFGICSITRVEIRVAFHGSPSCMGS